MKKVRKIILNLTVLTMLVVLTACSSSKGNKNIKDTTGQNNTTEKSVIVEDSDKDISNHDTQQNEENVKLIEELTKICDRNVNSLYNILSLYYLPYGDAPIVDRKYPIESEDFKSIQDIKKYLKNTYTDNAIDVALKKVEQLYCEIDGVLCIDLDKTERREYNVNWDNFKIKVLSADDKTCTFTVQGTIEEVGETLILEEYSVEISAKKVDGKWLLTEIFS